MYILYNVWEKASPLLLPPVHSISEFYGARI